MNNIHEKIQTIRDFVNNTWRQQTLLKDNIKWNKVCASMDVIGDTQIAISDFFSLGDFSAETGGYLYLYGLLQALVLQQDAINHMMESLFDRSINWKKDYPTIYKVRELRNNSIGHPTKRGNNKSFHFISRYSICRGSFQLMSHYSDTKTNAHTTINIQDLRTTQNESVITILEEVIELMKNEYEEHKKKFNGEKMINVTKDLGYPISKVYEGIYNNYPLTQINFSEIQCAIDKIKKETEDRYQSISALPGLNEVIRKIDYILSKMSTWINENNLLNNNDAEIFWDSFTDRLKELNEMLEEIDTEFTEIS